MKKKVKETVTMEKIIIDKEFLKGYKTLLIVLENCDVYEIGVEDILDVYCEVELIDKKTNEYSTGDGFIKIAARASQTVECSVFEDNLTGTEWDYRLKERLEMCDGCADMTSFSLRNKKNCDMDICVPYNPLEEIMYGNEIEYSNCPSLEIDSEGNMIIAFGERSKQPKRKDNNYDELIVGWKKAFGDYLPKVLQAKVNRLLTFGEEQINLSFDLEIQGENHKNHFAELKFIDCKSIEFEMYFCEEGDCEIVMSKMTDGRIYVGFWGQGIDFFCKDIQISQ